MHQHRPPHCTLVVFLIKVRLMMSPQHPALIVINKLSAEILLLQTHCPHAFPMSGSKHTMKNRLRNVHVENIQYTTASKERRPFDHTPLGCFSNPLIIMRQNKFGQTKCHKGSHWQLSNRNLTDPAEVKRRAEVAFYRPVFNHLIQQIWISSIQIMRNWLYSRIAYCQCCPQWGDNRDFFLQPRGKVNAGVPTTRKVIKPLAFQERAVAMRNLLLTSNNSNDMKIISTQGEGANLKTCPGPKNVWGQHCIL